ncbi:MAG: histidine--tRNA ligase [Candidatus Absconditabacteria bacterium]
MYRPSGFPEYSPAEQAVFDRVKSIIEKHYASFGYAHIYTPAVESNKILLAKSGNETTKQIFGLYGLAQGGEDLKDYSLHFDLTIPFARYILDHEGEIAFPFKRFQIQPVRRGERAQRGRFRELWQCDIDSVWRTESKDSMIFYDAETLIVIANILDEIKKTYFSDKGITIHYNNRKLIEGLLADYTNKGEIFGLFDKYYKIGAEKFEEELKSLTVNEDTQRILEFVSDPKKYLSHSKSEEGIQQLLELEGYLEKLNTKGVKLVFDPFITRGLDYYTGTVYETFLDDDMALGSISSGGRYDGLTKYIDPKRSFSGVGGSIGISRLMTLIFEQGEGSKQTTTNYLCIHFAETFSEIAKIADKLRSEGNNVEIYPVADKLGKQFSYADKKNIVNVVILGTSERDAGIYKVKNLVQGTETEFPL